MQVNSLLQAEKTIPVKFQNLPEYAQKRIIPEPMSGCWLWVGSWMKESYGVCSHNSRRELAHRHVYSYFHGKIAAGLFACHHCDNPPCVNPEHIFIGTPKDNAADASRKQRTARNKGEKDGMSVLKNADIPYIKSLNREGISCQSIARLFDVSHQTIWSVCRGHSWTHIHNSTDQQITLLDLKARWPSLRFNSDIDNSVFNYERLSTQLRHIYDLMISGGRFTLQEISQSTRYPEGSISARLRDFNSHKYLKQFFHTTFKRRGTDGHGPYEYCLTRFA